MTKRSPEERLWEKVRKTEGCWFWTGARNKRGYGHFWVAGRLVYVHRFAYELLVGPIPEGLEPDHVKANGCTSTACVKAIADEHGPAHLELVTHRMNLLRGDTITARHAAATHCPHGHPYDDANTYRDSRGYRWCRACNRESARRGRARRRNV